MYKIKRFSIQSGAPSNGGASLSRELKNRVGAGVVGGGILGGITSIPVLANSVIDKMPSTGLKVSGIIVAGAMTIGSIIGLLSSLGADARRAKATKTTMDDILNKIDQVASSTDGNGNRISEINPFRYIVTDEKPSSYNVTFSYMDGIMVIVLNKPSNAILESLNESLEEMIKFNRKSDYSSEQVKDGYIVTAIIPNVDSACGIIYNLIDDCRIKVNCITNKSTGKI